MYSWDMECRWAAAPHDHSQPALQRDHGGVSRSNICQARNYRSRPNERYRGEAKNDQDVVERAELDIKYIESWSLPLDFWIILNTMLQVVKPPKTAY